MAIVKRMTRRGAVFDARWRDTAGKQRTKTFTRQGDAKAHLAKIQTKQIGGSQQTLSWLADEFLAEKLALVEKGVREHATYESYEGQLRLFLKTDEVASVKCGDLDPPQVRAFFMRLLNKVSPAYARKIRTSVSTMLQWGVSAGHLAHNPARGVRLETADRYDLDEDDEDLSVDTIKIPTPEIVQGILAAADARKPKDKGRAGAQMRLLFFGGLRPSEMLGMPARAVAVNSSGQLEIKVVQRANKRGRIGRLKNKTSRRKVTLTKAAGLWIREYMLAAGLPKDGLLFPVNAPSRKAVTREGAADPEVRAEIYSNFRSRVWARVLAEAGFAEQVISERKYWVKHNKSERAEKGNVARVEVRPYAYWRPIFTPHQGRHFAASASIAAGVTPKKLQAFLGHKSLQVTMDVYGHLFPDQFADGEIAEAIAAMVVAARLK